LSNYPKLILEKDQLPPADRYYKGEAFELGIPDHERDRVFYRPQYILGEKQIEELKKLIKPLIGTGVYRPSNSPHNNPVLLVPKKNPGEYRMVVDSRQVNKVCRPVSGMCSSTLRLIQKARGAKYFSTLDCKNAFYSLQLAEKDRKFTAVFIPQMGKYELTRMPIGAKAVTTTINRLKLDLLESVPSNLLEAPFTTCGSYHGNDMGEVNTIEDIFCDDRVSCFYPYALFFGFLGDCIHQCSVGGKKKAEKDFFSTHCKLSVLFRSVSE